MAVVAESLIYDFIVGIIFLFVGLYLFFTSTFNYWKDRRVAFIKPLPIFGNLKDIFLLKKNQSELFQSFYNEMKGERFFGYFEIKSPALMIRDPELVEKILIKDFNHFYNRGIPADAKREPLSVNLSNLEDNQWRNLRYKLTPTFSTGKLKGMFDQVCNCGEGLIKCIEAETKRNKAVECKPLFFDFTLEVIASVAFGLKLDKDTEISRNFRRMINGVFHPSKLQFFRLIAVFLAPKFARKCGITRFSKEVEEFVMKLVRETLRYRKENNVIRNDFLQLMLNVQKQEKEGTLQFPKELYHDPEDSVINQMKYVSTVDEKEDNQSPEEHEVFMTEAVITAQSFIFFTAGSETVAYTINFALFNLALHPKIQEKVYDEIVSVLAKHNNEWSYHSVKDIIYLDQVIQESLRLYPISPFLFRVCTEPYKVPGSDLVIEKGTRITIPTMALHRDPEYYSNPEVFDPDRFQDNNFKPNGKYLPFGDGPRICIAMRFAVLEVKMALARILTEYHVKLSSKTKLPLEFKKSGFTILPLHGLWFEFDKRMKV